MIVDMLRRCLRAEWAPGAVLAAAAAAALWISNSPWSAQYEAWRALPGELRVGGDLLLLSKPLGVWVNDLWMAVFFFLVGLEIKREWLEGELATPRQAALPAVAALGGMAAPALIYLAVNHGDATALRGWAIPAATDIAFALGVLSLLGRRVPGSLKVLLTAVAIIDDLGAIAIIALFFTDHIAPLMLAAAAGCLFLLWLLNRAGVASVAVYALLGLLLWVCVLKSGLHATLAGVMTALAVPIRDARGRSPLKAVEHGLQPWVAFFILPVFAFANAGVSLHGVTPASLTQSIPLGIALGLVAGKAIGVYASLWAMVRWGGASRPAGASWRQCLGLALLCGIGFTMSLFIGGLAFEGLGPDYGLRVKLGVLCGSLLAGLLGVAVLWRASPASEPRA